MVMSKMEMSENENCSERRILCIGCDPSFLYGEKGLSSKVSSDPRVIMLRDDMEITEYLGDPAAEDWFRTVKINSGGRRIFFRIKDLLFVETRDNYLEIFLDSSVITRVSLSLRRFLEITQSRYIVRCHKAYAVNIRKVTEVRKLGRRRWEAVCNAENERGCPVGSAYYKDLMEKMEASCELC